MAAGANVFVTGTTGFLGSHLAARLVRDGCKVTCLVRRTSNLRWLNGLDVQFVYGDVGDEKPEALDEARDALAAAEYVVHVAGVTAAPRRAEYFRVNGDGTRRLMDALVNVEAKPKRVVLISSLAAIGPGKRYDDVVRDSDTPHPGTAYGASKRQGEIEFAKYAHRFDQAVIRPPAICGPRDVDILRFFKAAKRGIVPWFAGGRQHITMTYVDDVVSAIVLAMTHPAASGGAFLVGDGENKSLREIGPLIGAAVGRAKVRPIYLPAWLLKTAGAFGHVVNGIWPGAIDDLDPEKIHDIIAKCWAVDDTPLREKLGYKNSVTLREAFARTARWYEETGWL